MRTPQTETRLTAYRRGYGRDRQIYPMNEYNISDRILRS
ncbi:MAG: hypothetical protein AVDCRST_MAG91-1894 [uncultured Sphingomonadaceae bacterium]|uniref:Uncharacterized protein n=1 Tax=uncultured Sphingomonadaceae bacterium TaxID=169976 RepID=A0A6J4T7R7_9SPHN|nr:MAG: hypothetical protein AVDCRST_MAG91-1894 [uncultured Sphingomonadaceae bacterium]